MAEAGGAAPSNAAAGSHNNLQPPSPLDGGAFLLNLLQNPSQTSSPPQPRPDHHYHHHHHFDPAVAAVGPSHPILLHEFLQPRHQPPPPSHLPPGHFGDPQRLLQSLPFHLPQQFPPGLWPQAPPGFPPLGLDGPGLNHHIFHLEQQKLNLAEHQRLGLAAAAAAAAGGMTSLAASTERTDLGGNLSRPSYAEKGIDDHAAGTSGRKNPGTRNQGERSSLRPPPGFRQPPAGYGAEYDRGSARSSSQGIRSNQLKPQEEKSTASFRQINHSHGDRGKAASAFSFQRKLVDVGKPGQGHRLPSSGHCSATLEYGRLGQDNHRPHFEESNAHGMLPTGDIPERKSVSSAEMQENELRVGSDALADGQCSVTEHFDEESEHESGEDAGDEEDLATVERMKVLNGDEYADSVEQRTSRELDEICEETVNSLTLMVKKEVKSVAECHSRSRGKDFRSDLSRGHHVSSMRVRIQRRTIQCRRDIDAFSPRLLSIFESLIPAEEEKAKQKQLLLSLEKLVNKEWPNARLYLYGSCANSFGVSKSDIDVCLSIDDKNLSKIDILLKLAEILEAGNLQNVQALTRARVPIVKLMDPVTGLSCDICINNLLAVVNTRLLKDYARIDHRLRQLAFIVKHWARSRKVNETYQGTLSSYAYVLMCIHFLQLRRPAVLPCLQAMEATFAVTIDTTVCAYFNQVERLQAFGSRNNESIAQLLWGFFHYWAYRHDYTNDVISVRTGSILSKQAKDWTRRIGNDRHLICIEDPFETSHDLGRVVDKHSIKILREEFERAAFVLQYDPNPTVTLFEPYIRLTAEDLVK